MTTKFKYLIHFNNGEIIGIDDSNCLKHFGIQGMKWGVRKAYEGVKKFRQINAKIREANVKLIRGELKAINKVRGFSMNARIKAFSKLNKPYENRLDILAGKVKDPGPLFSISFKRLTDSNKKILGDLYKKQISNYENTKPNGIAELIVSQGSKYGRTLFSPRKKFHSEAPSIIRLRRRLGVLEPS